MHRHITLAFLLTSLKLFLDTRILVVLYFGSRSVYTIQPCTSLQYHFIRSDIRMMHMRSALGRASRLCQIKMLRLVELCALLVLFLSIIFDLVAGSNDLRMGGVSALKVGNWDSKIGALLTSTPPPFFVARAPSLCS